MGRPFIVLGDGTSHGGTVVESSQMTDTHGKGLARIGDKVTCPIPGHGSTVIVSGDPTMIVDGQPVARHGDKCACGAVLISSQVVSSSSEGGSSTAASDQAAKAQAAGYKDDTPPSPVRFDEQTKLVVHGDTATLVGLPWLIKTSSGQIVSGRLDASGELPRVVTDAQEEYETFWGEDAMEMGAQ